MHKKKSAFRKVSGVAMPAHFMILGKSLHKILKFIFAPFKGESFLAKVNILSLIELIMVMQRIVDVCIKSTIKRLLLLKPVIRDYIRHSIVINRFNPYKLSALREWNHVT